MQKSVKGEKIMKEVWRVIKYFLIAASAGLIEMGSFALLDKVTPWKYWPCYLIALVLSVVWNFTFNRKYTFHSANNVPIAMLKVAAYYAVFTPFSTWFGSWLADGHGWPGFWVTVINMLINGITEFLISAFSSSESPLTPTKVPLRKKRRKLLRPQRLLKLLRPRPLFRRPLLPSKLLLS